MRLSEALNRIIGSDQQLGYYISQRLINLSRFAKFAKPSIEAITGREFRNTADSRA